VGCIGDPRCGPALDLLESMRLPGGGFPAQKRYYQVTERQTSGRTRLDWGGVRPNTMNEYITLEAISILQAAGRIDKK
jgi:hypothetical protein